jgi:hypothetical protein
MRLCASPCFSLLQIALHSAQRASDNPEVFQRACRTRVQTSVLPHYSRFCGISRVLFIRFAVFAVRGRVCGLWCSHCSRFALFTTSGVCSLRFAVFVVFAVFAIGVPCMCIKSSSGLYQLQDVRILDTAGSRTTRPDILAFLEFRFGTKRLGQSEGGVHAVSAPCSRRVRPCLRVLSPLCGGP